MRGSLLFFAFLLVCPHHCAAQDVVSASAGLVQYFEGAVSVDDKPVEHKSGVFVSLKNGSIIRTAKGRAELLLTPGVYLRIDENSSLRMESNSLVDTRVELTNGAAILDNLSGRPDNALTLTFSGSEVRFPKPGVSRIDCDLAELQVYSGESKVKHHGTSTLVDASHIYYFRLEMTIDKFGEGATDEFYDWAHNRSDVIADHNQIALAEQADSADADATARMFAVPALSSLPGYIPPSVGYSSYASTIAPFYQYPQGQNFGYPFFTGLILLPPVRHKPVNGTPSWPVTAGSVYRPRPIVPRWPTSSFSGISSGITHYPSTGVHFPATASPARPAATPATPRISAPHVMTPHVAGHR